MFPLKKADKMKQQDVQRLSDYNEIIYTVLTRLWNLQQGGPKGMNRTTVWLLEAFHVC